MPAKCEKLADAITVAAGQLGAADKPIVITFVPSVDVGLITKGGNAMAECLGKMTGLTYKVEVGTSEAASIEALGGNKAQMGFLNTFAILLAKQKYDVDVALVAQRIYGFKQASGSYTSFDFDPDKALAGQLTSFYKPEFFCHPGPERQGADRFQRQELLLHHRQLDLGRHHPARSSRPRASIPTRT